MKSKTLKTKLFTGMLATMLIAPTVLGATPLLDGTPFAPVVAYADQMGANFNWTINKDTGNHGSELSAKTQIVQTTDGKSITLYLYEQSIGTLTLRWGETGSISTFNGGQVPTTVGNHNILIGDLGEVGSTDTISVNIAVDEYVAPIEKPLAPTNVVISQDGSYISAVVPQNSYAIVLDASGNEIGFSANANYIELDRKLKPNETVSVISQDMSTLLKSDPTYVTYLQAAQEITMEVWYVDIDTTKPIAPMGTVTGQENTQVQVDAISVDGYELVTQTPQYVIAQDGTQVVFQYKKKDVKPVETYATLTTKFVDEQGTEISKATTQDFLVGGTYTATAKTVDGYTLVGQSQKTGTMTKDGATETFTYKKNEVKPPVEQKATLTTKFVDEKGQEIANSVMEEVVVGKGYTTQAKEIEGYKVKGTGTIQGVMSSEGKTETFVYESLDDPFPGERILTVRYLDKDTMKEIKQSKVETHEQGSKITVQAEKIEGYTALVNEQTVTLTDDQTVTFLYSKDSIIDPIEKPENAKNVKFIEGTKGTEITADIPSGLTMKVEYKGEIVAESNKSGNIKLSKAIATGQSISYYTVNSDNVKSDVATLVRTDIDEVDAVDFSELEKLVAEAKKIDLDDYTDETAQALRVELINAEKVLANGLATQDQVDTAYFSLLDALNNLEIKDDGAVEVDFSKLEQLVDGTHGIDLTKYTDESTDAVYFYLIEAEAVLANENATQTEVDTAYDNLAKALSGLVLKDETPVEPTNPVDPTKPTEEGQQEVVDKEQAKAKESNTKKSENKSDKELPKTGENKGLFGILTGSTLLASALFVSRFRKR